MIFDADEAILIVTAAWFFFKMTIFAAISFVGYRSVPPDKRTRFGNALRGLFAGLTLTSLGIGILFLLRWLAGPPPALPVGPTWLALTMRGVLLVGLAITTWYGIRALRATLTRHREDQRFVIDNAGVLGSLGQAMPIIVADHHGIIRHTTGEFDVLAGYSAGELIGRDLQVLIPDRYEHAHQLGIDRYVKTREPHIVGTVVSVELLRKDGTEVNAYLALNTTDVEGDPWFVASMWTRPMDVTPARSTFTGGVTETIESTADDVADVKQRVERIEQKMDGPP